MHPSTEAHKPSPLFYEVTVGVKVHHFMRRIMAGLDIVILYYSTVLLSLKYDSG